MRPYFLLRYIALFSILILCPLSFNTLRAQIKDVGLPLVNSFSREDYKAGTQNWSITQDENGFIYFANNQGVMRFDGHNWDLFPLPNNSVVRTVMYFDGKIYAGGFDEFGYFKYNERGDFAYTSLSVNLNSDSGVIDEIWRIHPTTFGLVFQSYTQLFILQDDQLLQVNPRSRFGFSFQVNNKIIVVDREIGLFQLGDGSLKEWYLNESFFSRNEISFMISLGNEKYMLGTSQNGIHILENNRLRPWGASINEMLRNEQIYTALELSSEQVAIGTVQNGVYIIDKDGSVIQHVNRYKGLQDNTVLSLFRDVNENLWLGLNNGIGMLEISSPITLLNYSFNIEATYTSIVHNDILYIGTNQGLYARPFDQIGNENYNRLGFRLIEGTKGQVWSLEVFDGQLFCGHNFGTFIIEGFRAKQLTDIQGGWDYISLPGDPNTILGGTYSGLIFFTRSYGSHTGWKLSGRVEGFEESSRELAFDKTGTLWITHGYKGVFRLRLSSDLRKVELLRLYNAENGLPSIPYTITIINDETIFSTREGLFRYESDVDTFLRDEALSEIIGPRPNLSRVIEDYFGDIWFFTTEDMGVLRIREDGKYNQITIPFRRVRNQFLGETFSNVYSYDNRNIFIGGLEGMLHYDPVKGKNYDLDYKVYIRDLMASSGRMDSLLYPCYGLHPVNQAATEIELPFKFNSLRFGFSAPSYESPDETLFSYRLLGYEENWSDWNENRFKEYSNLNAGEYTLEIRSKNVYERESQVTSFSFSIRPPIYRSVAAYISYLILILLAFLIGIRYIRRRVDKARRLENIKHQEELTTTKTKHEEREKRSEEQIERLENEKLIISMRHKNMELANATMHLIQKNQFLTRIKEELNKLRGEAKVESVKSDIKQIIKRIDKDFKDEKHWELFDKYFHEVHQDFLERLMERHPVLTPNDLRLCAYLRMNLSTKEIAPLMNISVRGLEISRYRIRKKMQLGRDVNLTEYIMKV